MELKDKLIEIRRHYGYPQWKMGRHFGVTLQCYHWWEKGAFKPRPDKVEAIEQLYIDLFKDEKEMQHGK